MQVSDQVSLRRVYSELTPQEFDDGMDAAAFHGIGIEVREHDHSIITLVRPNQGQIDAFEKAVGYAPEADDIRE